MFQHMIPEKFRKNRDGGRSYGAGTIALGTVLVALLIGGATFFCWHEAGAAGSPAATRNASPTTPHASASIPPSPSPSASLSPTPPPSLSPSPTEVPATGPGTFVTARADGLKVGHGHNPLRYMVQVERGLDISPNQAAEEISTILADPRGWTANAASSFQLVSSPPYDLRIRIATAGTADSLCLAGIGQDTGGELNCEVPRGVVVNLKRWVLGSPTFDGPIHDYRALIINHEMGHFLGHQHETCPGPGKLAPVMMQQIKGLKGCRANAWPYDSNGHYISGPPVS